MSHADDELDERLGPCELCGAPNRGGLIEPHARLEDGLIECRNRLAEQRDAIRQQLAERNEWKRRAEVAEKERFGAIVHHNPDCQMTGDPHRHNRWNAAYGSRFGSGAPDLAGRTVPEMFSVFLVECGIVMAGALEMPAIQGGLFP